jgi:hypothetical protein
MDARLFEVLLAARQTARRLAGLVVVVLAGNSTDQIEHVKFDR